MLDKLGIESEFRGDCASRPRRRWTSSGWCSSARCSASSSGSSTTTAARGRALRRGRRLFTAEPTNTIVDGEEVDLGLVGEVASVRPRPSTTWSRRSDPGDLQRRPRRGRPGPQRQRRHGGRCPGDRLGAEKLSSSPTSRASTATGRQRRRHPGDQPESLAELMPTLASGMVPKMEACLQAVTGGVAKATVVDGRNRTPCCSSCSPTRASAPRCCPASPPRSGRHSHDRPGAVRRRPHEHVRPTRASRW